MTDDYYEDSHGNKIVGYYSGLKFAFSGFNSIIKVGENVNLRNSSIYIHSDARVDIDDDCMIENSVYTVGENVGIKIGAGCVIRVSELQADDSSHIEIGACNIITSNHWVLRKGSEFKSDYNGKFGIGDIFIGENGSMTLGRTFSIGKGFYFAVNNYTQIIIGEDVMCSYSVNFRSGDGHSIFDVHTGKNINSTEDINKNRKIVVGDHVWIGMNTIILYNTEICDGSIIGAGSLVKGRIPNNCIATGVPAKVIKRDIAWSRKENADELMECEKAYAKLTE